MQYHGRALSISVVQETSKYLFKCLAKKLYVPHRLLQYLFLFAFVFCRKSYVCKMALENRNCCSMYFDFTLLSHL